MVQVILDDDDEETLHTEEKSDGAEEGSVDGDAAAEEDSFKTAKSDKTTEEELAELDEVCITCLQSHITCLIAGKSASSRSDANRQCSQALQWAGPE